MGKGGASQVMVADSPGQIINSLVPRENWELLVHMNFRVRNPVPQFLYRLQIPISRSRITPLDRIEIGWKTFLWEN